MGEVVAPLLGFAGSMMGGNQGGGNVSYSQPPPPTMMPAQERGLSDAFQLLRLMLAGPRAQYLFNPETAGTIPSLFNAPGLSQGQYNQAAGSIAGPPLTTPFYTTPFGVQPWYPQSSASPTQTNPLLQLLANRFGTGGRPFQTQGGLPSQDGSLPIYSYLGGLTRRG